MDPLCHPCFVTDKDLYSSFVLSVISDDDQDDVEAKDAQDVKDTEPELSPEVEEALDRGCQYLLPLSGTDLVLFQNDPSRFAEQALTKIQLLPPLPCRFTCCGSGHVTSSTLSLSPEISPSTIIHSAWFLYALRYLAAAHATCTETKAEYRVYFGNKTTSLDSELPSSSVSVSAQPVCRVFIDVTITK